VTGAATCGARPNAAELAGAARPGADRHPFITHAYAIAAGPDPEGPYPAGWVFGLNTALRGELFLRLGRARLRGMVHEGRRRARGSRGDAVSGAAAHVVGGLPDPPGGQGPATQTP